MVQESEKGLKLNYKTQLLVYVNTCRLFFHRKNKHSKKKTEKASYWLIREFDHTQMLRKPSTQSDYIIFCSGPAAVAEVAWYTKTASARNSQSVLPLEFDLSELKVQYRSSSLQLQCGPVVF